MQMFQKYDGEPRPHQLLHDRPVAVAARAAPGRQLERPAPQLFVVDVIVAASEGRLAADSEDAVAAAGAGHRHALQAGRDGREQVTRHHVCCIEQGIIGDVLGQFVAPPHRPGE